MPLVATVGIGHRVQVPSDASGALTFECCILSGLFGAVSVCVHVSTNPMNAVGMQVRVPSDARRTVGM